MYNTVLSSSAPVERLFSVGGAVLTPKQNRLAGVKFEKLLLILCIIISTFQVVSHRLMFDMLTIAIREELASYVANSL